MPSQSWCTRHSIPNGTHVATSNAQGNLFVCQSETDDVLDQMSSRETPLAVAFLPDDRLQVVAQSGTVMRADLNRHWQFAHTIGTPDDASTLQDRVTALCFSPDSATLAVGGGQPSRGGELDLYRVADGSLIRELADAHSDTVFGVAFSPDGKLLASCGADRFMKIFAVDTGTHVRTFKDTLTMCWLTSVGATDGRVLATGSTDKVVKLWNFSDGSQLRLPFKDSARK